MKKPPVVTKKRWSPKQKAQEAKAREMAARNGAKPRKTNGHTSSQSTLSMHRDGEGRLVLDELSLYKLRTFEAELRDVTSSIMLKQASREAYVRSIDPKGHLHAMDAELGQLRQMKEQAAGNYTAIKADLQALLGEDASSYALEDKTGVLTKLESAVNKDQSAESAGG
jgi:hypothetical protein